MLHAGDILPATSTLPSTLTATAACRFLAYICHLQTSSICTSFRSGSISLLSPASDSCLRVPDLLPWRCTGCTVRRASLCAPGSAQLSDEPHHRQSYIQNKEKGADLFPFSWCVPMGKKGDAKFFTGAPTTQSAISIRSP